MRTRYEQMTAGGLDGYSNFAGDDSNYRDWFAVPVGQSRDSDVLEKSNFDAALKQLGGEGDDVMVCRYGHWAVGWVEQIYVRPNSDAFRMAEEIEEELEQYPILDEDDFYNREVEEAERVWSDVFDTQGRIEYIRDNRSQFEFHDFADMMGCVRGKYFSGYHSELLTN